MQLRCGATISISLLYHLVVIGYVMRFSIFNSTVISGMHNDVTEAGVTWQQQQSGVDLIDHRPQRLIALTPAVYKR